MKLLAFCPCLFALLCLVTSCNQRPTTDIDESDILRRILTARDSTKVLTIAGKPLSSPELVNTFYSTSGYQVAWRPRDALLVRCADLLIAVDGSRDHGLRPMDYHVASLSDFARQLNHSPGEVDSAHLSRRVEFDILLTDAFLTLASHLHHGKVHLGSDADQRSDSVVMSLLRQVIVDGRIGPGLSAIAPAATAYRALQTQLRQYRSDSTATDWAVIPRGKVLRQGTKDLRVRDLHRRLFASGDLSDAEKKSSNIFGGATREAVCQFQKRHNFEETGVVDSATLSTLNVPLATRIKQISANLERMRWEPRDRPRPRVRVNIGDQMLYVVEQDTVVMRMKVVIGLRDWPTPMFTSSIDRVVFNPTWVSPRHILVTELINYMKADSNYLSNNKMTLLRGDGRDQVIVDPKSIDWRALQPKDVDFQLRQEPGVGNIMGRVKFLAPNDYDIYLHDTPYREDFPKPIRLASHGCIRLERPFDFAEYLLRNTPGWSRRRIDTVIQRMKEQTVVLPHPMPVEVMYQTVWVDRDGLLQVREDVYGLDERVAALLEEANKTRSRKPSSE